MADGKTIFSPVVHGAAIDELGFTERRTQEFWLNQCEGMLKLADRMYVLMLDGWDSSAGIHHEIEFCKRHKIPWGYIAEGELEPIQLYTWR